MSRRCLDKYARLTAFQEDRLGWQIHARHAVGGDIHRHIHFGAEQIFTVIHQAARLDGARGRVKFTTDDFQPAMENPVVIRQGVNPYLPAGRQAGHIQLAHIKKQPQPRRIGNHQLRADKLRRICQHQIGANFLARRDVFFHQHAGQRRTQPENLIGAGGAATVIRQRGSRAIAFGPGGNKSGFSGLDVFLRGGSLPKQILVARQSFISRGKIAGRRAGIGQRLAEFRRVEQRQCVARRHALVDFAGHGGNATGNRRINADCRVIIPRQPSGQTDCRRLAFQCRLNREVAKLRRIGWKNNCSALHFRTGRLLRQGFALATDGQGRQDQQGDNSGYFHGRSFGQCTTSVAAFQSAPALATSAIAWAAASRASLSARSAASKSTSVAPPFS